MKQQWMNIAFTASLQGTRSLEGNCCVRTAIFAGRTTLTQAFERSSVDTSIINIAALT